MFIMPAVAIIIVEYMVYLVVDCCVKYVSLLLKLELWQNNVVSYFPPTPLNGSLPCDLLLIVVVSRVSSAAAALESGGVVKVSLIGVGETGG